MAKYLVWDDFVWADFEGSQDSQEIMHASAVGLELGRMLHFGEAASLCGDRYLMGSASIYMEQLMRYPSAARRSLTQWLERAKVDMQQFDNLISEANQILTHGAEAVQVQYRANIFAGYVASAKK